MVFSYAEKIATNNTTITPWIIHHKFSKHSVTPLSWAVLCFLFFTFLVQKKNLRFSIVDSPQVSYPPKERGPSHGNFTGKTS